MKKRSLDMNNMPNGQGAKVGAVYAGSRNMAVSNVAKLDAEHPIPLYHNGSLFVSFEGKQYVPFLNPKDSFFQFLAEAKLLSPTTASCVNSKAEYCIGRGIRASIDGAEADDNPIVEGFYDWAKHLNRSHQSLNDVANHHFKSILTYGNTFIEVIRGAVAGKKFIKVVPRKTMDCRMALPDDDDVCNTVLISKYFRRENNWAYQKDYTGRCIPLYSPNTFDKPWYLDKNGFEHTIFHLKNETELDYYGLPSNISSLVEQLLEYKYARSNYDNLNNNMVMGGILTLKAATTDEEARKIAKNIINTHTGDGKTGRWMVIHSESGMGEGTEVKQFDTRTDGSFIDADTRNENKIYVANQWNKILIGGTENKGIGSGNSSYIRSVFDIANNTVIKPAQAHFIEKFLCPLMTICDEWMGTQWGDLDIDIATLPPISLLSDIDVNAVLTKNEGREILGKCRLEGEEWEQPIKGTAPKEVLPVESP